MNLVQKLPIGLSLACVLMLSSCSKEDGLTPEPKMESVNAHSSLRDGIGASALLNFPSTNGPKGYNTYAPNWERNTSYSSDNLITIPTGTSSLTHLWGNGSMPWIKPLPPFPSGQNDGSIITVTSNSNTFSQKDKRSAAKTKIKGLKPGTAYLITFYVATTNRVVQGLSNIFPAYAEEAVWEIGYSGFLKSSYVDFKGKEGEWIKQTYAFIPQTTEAFLGFSARTPLPGKFSYAHIYVANNAIEVIK